MKLLLTACLLTTLAGPANASKILIIGDSISVREDGSSDPGIRSWSYQLEQQNPIHEFANIALGATTTRSWTHNVGFALIDAHLDADIVLLLLGANDSNSLNRIPADEYFFRMSWIASRFASEKVYISLPYDKIGLDEAAVANALLADYRALLASIPNRGADLTFMADPRYLQWDGVHPNQLGHNLIAQSIAASVPSLVPEPGTLLLFALGLMGLSCLGRSRARTLFGTPGMLPPTRSAARAMATPHTC